MPIQTKINSRRARVLAAFAPIDRPLARAAATAVEALEGRLLLAAGDPDSAFNGGGLLRFGFDGGHVIQVALAGDEVGDAGDVLVGGYADAADGGDRFDYLARFNSDGSADTSFDGDGILALPNPTADSAVYQIVGLADGDALVARGAAGDGATISRYNADGALDGGFATGGTLVIPEYQPRLALLPGGGFVAAGTPGGDAAADLFVRVYGDNGSPRGSGFQTNLADQADFQTVGSVHIAVAASGAIFVAGDVTAPPTSPPSGSPARASVFKLDAGDLSLDDSFGVGGEARRNFAGDEIFNVRDLAVDPFGRPVLAVNEDDGVSRLVRFTTGGLIETDAPFRFDVDGPFNASNEVVRVLPQADAKLLVVGYFEQTDNAGDAGDAAAARLNADFTADASFGDDSLGVGQRRYDLGNADDQLLEAYLTDAGEAVLLGRTINTSPAIQYDAVALRLELNEDPDPPTPPPAPAFASLDGGTLRVTGGADAESITVSTEGEETVVTVAPAGGTTQSTRFFTVDIITVSVDAGGGNDTVTYDLLAPLHPPRRRRQ